MKGSSGEERACSAGNSSVFSVPLCPLCQTQPSSSTRLCHAGQALGVFFEHRGHRGTEDTEKLRYFSSGLSKPFLRYLRTCRTSGRTGVDEASAMGRKPAFTPQPRFMRRGWREAQWITEMSN